MGIQRLNACLSIAGQPQLLDMRGLYNAGFRSIVCNRPDGEGADQPTFAEIEHEATLLGIQARYLPVVAGAILSAHGAAFAALLTELPGPVLAYCRTGKRSAALWDLADAGDS
jgi:sulfide:quinone oxidoreductase